MCCISWTKKYTCQQVSELLKLNKNGPIIIREYKNTLTTNFSFLANNTITKKNEQKRLMTDLSLILIFYSGFSEKTAQVDSTY